MKDFFYQISDKVFSSIRGDEWCELYLSSENTDFVRINNSKIRQPGHVDQHYLTVRLGKGNKKVSSTLSLSTNMAEDLRLISNAVSDLRIESAQAPNDPYLVKIDQPTQIEHEATNILPTHEKVLDTVLTRAKNNDLVGLYTTGEMYRGFSNSFGQRNWFSNRSFHMNWSLFHQQDIALKSSYMGNTWDDLAFDQKWSDDARQFQILQRPRQTLAPGNYRVFLSPSAVDEIIRLLSWGAFGVQEIKNKTSPLLKLLANEEHFHPHLDVHENTELGIAPVFNTHGDIRPKDLSLIKHGNYNHSLVSSRSARQFNIPSNAAEDHEQPTSLEINAGTLEHDQILPKLDKGIYINNLWYLNYSDRQSCRTTGMTRFATFWVENGEIQHPVKVMRFDESLFQALGKNLEALTKDRELILSSDTFMERKAHCSLLPGALIDNFNFCQ